MTTETRRIARATPGTLFREVDGESVLLQIDTGEYFGLDAVGTRIWQLIVEKGDLGEVAAAVIDEFDVAAERARGDLDRLVDQLTAMRLVTVERV